MLTGPDPRVELWEWMRAPTNAFFAPSFVNRLWHHYFGTGIVDPPEDFNQGNPTNEHLRNFIDAIQGKAELNCPAIVGHQAAVTGHLATASFRSGKKAYWDEEQGTYHLG